MKCNILSLGCPKNLVESEEIIGTLGAAGAEIAIRPDDADILIINTCGFIEPAMQETRDEIQKALVIAQQTDALVYVYGCAVDRNEEDLRTTFPEISRFFHIQQRQEMIEAILNHHITRTNRLVTTHGYAYLKIADGCSNHCAYCTIPLIRGPFRSIPEHDILEHVHELADLGIKELILVAQDTTRYGEDLYGESRLADLIRSCGEIQGISWVRLLYAHPRGITDTLLSEFKQNERVCNYLDMPIQHINDRLLNMVNRQTSKRQIDRIFSRLSKIKGFSVRTTVIAGLPTETDLEFMELINYLKQSIIGWLGVSKYYPESGTRAASLPQLDPKLIDERYDQLLDVQQELLQKRYKEDLGTTSMIMIHGRNGLYQGHNEHSCPEIDDPILIKDQSLRYGHFYPARFDHLDEKHRYAEIIHEK